MSMPEPMLNAFINRMPAVHARFQLALAEAVLMGMAGGEAYVAWRTRLEQFIRGDGPVATASGQPESFLSIRARREAGRAERERVRRETALA